MTVLCDFQTIIGDNFQPVPVVPSGAKFDLGGKFRTGGRIAGTQEVDPLDASSQSAVLIYSVRNMAGTAQVFVNDHGPVGLITATPPGTAWSTQVITMGGSRLKDGDNQITLKDVTDQFEIKDLICFYHQDSG